MCLLITGKSNVVRSTLLNTAGLIEDIYQHNADGVGLMYCTTAGLKVCKRLPIDAAQVRGFIDRMPTDDREVALHFRWRTHGLITLDQCHPYPVCPGVALMHNGVLDGGNAGDMSKSDTWHFIEDYLKTLPVDAFHDERFTNLIGEFIGENRFAIMSADGRLTVINKDQGVEHNGVWYSNTYAWTPGLVIPSYRRAPAEWWNATTDDTYDTYDSAPRLPGYANRYDDGGPYNYDMADEIGYDVDSALNDQDVPVVQELLEEYPEETLRYLTKTYSIDSYAGADDTDLPAVQVMVRNYLIAGDWAALAALLAEDSHGAMANHIASTLLWYCTTRDYTKELA